MMKFTVRQYQWRGEKDTFVNEFTWAVVYVQIWQGRVFGVQKAGMSAVLALACCPESLHSSAGLSYKVLFASPMPIQHSACPEPLCPALDGWIKTGMRGKKTGLIIQFGFNSNKGDILL